MIGRRVQPSTQEADKPKGFDDYELRLGDVMRGERATLSKSLLDVQRELKIKAGYIAAIENADASAFETPGFVAGYVRSYARYLGLDPEWAYEKFCREANFSVHHGMSAAASGPKSRPARVVREGADAFAAPSVPFAPRGQAALANVQPGALGSIAVLLALVGGIGYGGWAVLQEVQRVQLAPVDQAPGIVAELDPVAGAGFSSGTELGENDLAALQDGNAPSSVEIYDRLYRPEALDVPVLTARDGPIASIDPRTVGAWADAGAVVDPLPGTAVPALGETPVQVVADAAPGVEILAVRPSWVRVSAADGTVIFEKILDAGERYAVPQMEEAPLLRAGNSGSVYFAVAGETYGPAAEGAQVVKNIALTPEALTAAYAVADMAQDADLARFAAVEPVMAEETATPGQ
jgi:cytoskeletal protein RodZ